MSSNAVSTRLTDEALAEVDRIAKEVGLTRSNVITYLVIHGIRHPPKIFADMREFKEKKS